MIFGVVYGYRGSERVRCRNGITLECDGRAGLVLDLNISAAIYIHKGRAALPLDFDSLASRVIVEYKGVVGFGDPPASSRGPTVITKLGW